MQSLVYILIGLCALGVAGIAWALSFSPIESFVVGVAFFSLAVLFMERALRKRAEDRLERAVEELSRLLSTDAQAGNVLSQRINALADENAGRRLDALEADVSVLGTVVRQMAETMADMDQSQRSRQIRGLAAPVIVEPDPLPEPEPAKQVVPPVVEPQPARISLLELRNAIDDGRMVFHFEPIFTLPQRRIYGGDMVPRLMMPGGDLANVADVMPKVPEAGDVERQVAGAALAEAVTIARRAIGSPQRQLLHVPLPRSMLSATADLEHFLAVIEFNGAVAEDLVLILSDADRQGLEARERAGLAALARTGAGLSISGMTSLRVDFGPMVTEGLRSVRVDAAELLQRPGKVSDLHTVDIVPYLRRYGVELMATNIVAEDQILSLFDYGIPLGQGPHLGRPAATRSDQAAEQAEPLRRRAER